MNRTQDESHKYQRNTKLYNIPHAENNTVQICLQKATGILQRKFVIPLKLSGISLNIMLPVEYKHVH